MVILNFQGSKYKGFNLYILIALSSILLNCTSHTDGNKGNRNISDPLSDFQVADGFDIELIVAEPLISDPVAVEVDEMGRMFVVEMHGYPLDKSGSGNVKLVIDSDGDGKLDRASVFASNLKFPTGILRWKKGILVTDPPNLLYFEDTDADGVADIRDTILTGFAVSNPQHNFNNPIFGIDNWIYISNEPAVTPRAYKEEFGDTGSEVYFYGEENGPVLRQNAGGQGIRIKPDEKKMEYTSSRSQYGHSFDPWGHHFLVSNSNHVFHEVIQGKYLERNKDLLISSANESISDHGNSAQVYPITENPEYQIFTDVGVFTSACGSMFYNGGIFPSVFNKAIFVAEPVSNIVHVDVLEEKGATFVAKRLYEKKEFLASRDSWFRPVNHYIGPDGGLYVVDYYRRVIEHPEWMGNDAVEAGILYEGRDQGRIYRVVPEGTSAIQWTDLNMSVLSDTQLIGLLDSPNGWTRRNAQRLLVDRGGETMVPELINVIMNSSSPLGRLHAGWTLSGIDNLTSEAVIQLLKDKEAGIRENAIIMAEEFFDDVDVLDQLKKLEKDENSRVRFQLLCSLGSLDNPEINAIRYNMAIADIEDPWFQIGVLTANSSNLNYLLEESIRNYKQDKRAYGDFIKRIVGMRAIQNDLNAVRSMIHKSFDGKDKNEEVSLAILQGISQIGSKLEMKSNLFNPERELIINHIFSESSDKFREACFSLLQQMGLQKGAVTDSMIKKAVDLVEDKEEDETDRKYAIMVLGLADEVVNHSKVIKGVLEPNEPILLQRAALKSIYRLEGPVFLQSLIDSWSTLTPSLRSETIHILLSTEENIKLLINALEKNEIDPSIVEWRQRVWMMAFLVDDELRERSRNIFEGDDKKELSELVDNYQDALKQNVGNPQKGLEVYKNHCALCHQIGGENGIAYGPDLATIQNRRKISILKDILDPNLSIADGYDLWEITLKNGEFKQGIIGSETSTSINLRILGAEDEIISRDDVEEIRARNISVMPPNFDTQINVQEMADLLAFIKSI